MSAAAAVAGFVSVVVLLTRLSGGGSIFDTGQSWRVLVQGQTACAALAAIVAQVLRDRKVAIGCALVGLFILAAVALSGTSATSSTYSNGVAAGLVIAGGSSMTTAAVSREKLQGWLFGGALTAALLANPLEHYRSQVEDSGAYTTNSTPTDWPIFIAASVAFVLLAGAGVAGRTDFKRSDKAITPPESLRALVLGVGIALTSVLLWWWFIATEVFGDSTDTAERPLRRLAPRSLPVLARMPKYVEWETRRDHPSCVPTYGAHA